ncbi:MAG: lamin tail domain-containing protein, partial [Calditrichia bacterium]|nr:lamin tail domain-containing protein [Calditrichia bacterium]
MTKIGYFFITSSLVLSFAGRISAQADKLLVSEFVVTPTVGEFVEIYNPSDSPALLSDYYLTDATFAAGGQFYYNIVTDTNDGGGDYGDFHARFPDGAMIQPAEYQTIAMNGSNFATTYGVQPTYELWDTDSSIPDMREAKPGSINNQGGLNNSDEVIILYFWDGMSDLVADVDYVLYNSNSPTPNNEAVDKTGVRIDGPDADTDSSEYLPDTPTTNQLSAINHSDNASVHR